MYNVFHIALIALKAAGVEVLVLKGAYLAEALYIDIALRQFSDIDLLINEEDGEKSIQALQIAGFKADVNEVTLKKYIHNEFNYVHYPHMVFNGVSIEIHICLHNKNENYNLSPLRIMQNAEKFTLHGLEVMVQDMPDLLIFICVHLNKHFVLGHLQFTSFNDVVNLLVENENSIDWMKFTERCQEYNCQDIVMRYLLLAYKFYNAPLPQDIVNKHKVSLREKDEELFLKYLRGDAILNYTIASQFRNIRHLDGYFAKIEYFIYILFPPKEFMIKSQCR